MKKLFSLLLVLLIVFSGLVTRCGKIDSILDQDQTLQTTPISTPDDTSDTFSTISFQPMTVSILDVGQADCIVYPSFEDYFSAIT